MADFTRATDCTPSIRAGRLAKAKQFMEAADFIETLADDATDVADAYVTLCVHTGIAAADVICCARLDVHVRYKRARRAARQLVDTATELA